MRSHDIVCVHTMVGYLVSTDNYFRIYNGQGYSGTESHYGVGGKWGPDLGGNLDGAVWQWQDRGFQASANYEGNGRVISIETADNAARPIQPWTPAQISALIKLIAWECSPVAHAACPSAWRCRSVGIPPVLIPDTRSDRRGIGYHAQGAADYIAGERWSTSPTKDCPTAVRVSQLRSTVIPGVVAVLMGAEDMPLTPTDGQTVWDTRVEIPGYAQAEWPEGRTFNAEQMLFTAAHHARNMNAKLTSFVAESVRRDGSLATALVQTNARLDALTVQASQTNARLADLIELLRSAEPVPTPTDPEG